jgi:hypothetical protein
MVQTFFLYVDPGSGSYLIQIIIASVLGVAFYIKAFWYQIKSFFSRKKPKAGDDTDIQ